MTTSPGDAVDMCSIIHNLHRVSQSSLCITRDRQI